MSHPFATAVPCQDSHAHTIVFQYYLASRHRCKMIRSPFVAIFLAAFAAFSATPAQADAPARIRIGAVGVPVGGKVVGISIVTLAQSEKFFDEAFAGTNTKVDINYLTG